MKILRLDLLAFGPFTDVTLSPGDGKHGFHIVYGPNEAGKSSSLRALRQLLFGIPNNTSDNFIHPNTNLRIGGLIESAEGNRFEFIRRKGRSKTLRKADDVEIVDEAELTELLGDIDEKMFNQRFGIDYEELRQGGEAVVRGGGDLGEILFAAGAGIADLGRIQKQLDEEIEELFKPRGSKQRINRAIAELNDKRRTIKESLLPTSQWKRNDDAMKSAKKRKEEIESQLSIKRTEQSRLKRFHQAIPLICERKQQLRELESVANAPLLPDDFSSKRSSLIAQLHAEKQTEQETTEKIKILKEQIAGVDYQSDLLEHRTAISQLHTDLGSYKKALKDRPRLAAELEQTEEQIKNTLNELGWNEENNQTTEFCLTRLQKQRIQTLAAERQLKIGSEATLTESLKTLKKQIQQAENELSEFSSIENLDQWKRTVREIQKQGNIDQELDAERLQLSELEQQIQVDLKKLRHWSGSVEELETLAVPGIETIERFENEFSNAREYQNRIKEQINTLNSEVQHIEQTLETLQNAHDVPSMDDLNQARALRDEAWKLLEKIWQNSLPEDDSSVKELIDHFPKADNLKQAFQESIEHADSIADRLLRDAEHVAEKAKLHSDRARKEDQLKKLDADLESANHRLEQLQSDWLGEWAALNVEPLSPREMRGWLNQQQKLVEAASELRNKRMVVEEISSKVQSCHRRLSDLLEKSTGETSLQEYSLSSLLEQAEQFIEKAELAQVNFRNQEKDLLKLRNELNETEQNAITAKQELEQWQNEWEEAVAVLKLHRDSQPSEANLVIDALDRLSHLLKEANSLRERIQGIDTDNENFNQSVSQLLNQVAPELTDRPVELAVADLYDRLDSASTAKTSLKSWSEQIETEQFRHNKSVSSINHLNELIKTMCEQAGCESSDELPEVEQQSSLRRKIEEEIKSINQRLSDLTAGSSLEEFITEAEKLDADQIQAEILQLDDEILQLESDKSEVAETIGSIRNELRRMDGSGRAAQAQEEAELLIAGIRSDTAECARLKLASGILRRSIERFRNASQGPIIKRASKLFSELTLNSFDGLRVDYDDKDRAVLVGIRSQSGQTVHVENMSDGTCDQMYLAIRLALLEATLQNRQPIPFIVDDILIMFDDARAVAALKILAELSYKTQVIFFTHHEHLLDLAREHIDEKVLYTHTISA